MSKKDPVEELIVRAFVWFFIVMFIGLVVSLGLVIGENLP